MIELIHEQKCKTNGGIFLSNKEEVEFNDLYSEAAVNAKWLNIYKALCCSINDKLQKLTKTFITKSFIEKVQEEEPDEPDKKSSKKSSKSSKSKEPSWTDNDTMTNEEVSALDKEITDEISKIIIDIDRGFLELYLFDTMTPKKLNKINDLKEQLASLEQ
jgi:triacylglycerol esterase/lipase EstA (alpha/beta hydrolase family)